MSIVLRSDFENVKAQLEDTQESLAAAFARIEVFRQREKLLLAEVSKLRTAQGANALPANQQLQPQQESSTLSTSSNPGAASSVQQLQDSAPSSSPAAPTAAQQTDPQQQQQQQAGPQVPCYITDVEGHLPVMLLSSSGRRTPGSIVVTPDYVDFVEVRARIKRHAFIGITSSSVRGHSAGKQGSTGLKLKNLLPSCMSPSQMPTGSPPPRYSKTPGGATLVQPADVTNSVSNTAANSTAPGAWIAAAAASDIQPEASSYSWQQQLHYQDVPAAAAAAVSSPNRIRRSSAGAAAAASSPRNIPSPRSPTAEAVLSPTPETPSGWAASHSLRHCPTWHAGHASSEAAAAAGVSETELTETGVAAAAGAAAGSNSPRGSNGSVGDGEQGKEAKGVWKILWRGGGMQQQLVFEATHTTREVLHRHTLRWLGEADTEVDELAQLAAAAAAGGGSSSSDSTAAIAAGAAAGAAAAGSSGVEMAVSKHLVNLTPGAYTPRLSEPSAIIQSGSSSSSSSRGPSSSSFGAFGSPSIGGISIGIGVTNSGGAGGARPQSLLAAAAAAAAAGSSGSSAQLVAGLSHIAAALPMRYQTRDWQLLYSTARHGISLNTLFRKASGQSATVLLVRDTGGYVFGAFCPEVWRPNPRFFGTGETFVFQLAPHKVMWPWRLGSALKNDFFMYAQPDSLGVGGLGAFAIWLDGELLHGSSGSCGTFGSPCLASKEEFKVAVLELWGLQ